MLPNASDTAFLLRSVCLGADTSLHTTFMLLRLDLAGTV